MLKVLPRESEPNWLKEFEINKTINFRNIFENSFYYPACAFDGDVLNLCMGFSHSFIYVDNLCLWPKINKDEVLQKINSPKSFWGFQPIFQAVFDEKDLIGNQQYELELLKYEDGTPEFGLKPQPYFAILTIFEPKPNFNQSVRSLYSTHSDVNERFSFLYICTDGAIGFQKYYFSHNVRPKGIAVIQPGDAFGGNWTSYYDQAKIFSRAVRKNQAGMPDLMIFGGKSSSNSIFRQPFWTDYPYRNYYSRCSEKAIATWTQTRINDSDKYFSTTAQRD